MLRGMGSHQVPRLLRKLRGVDGFVNARMNEMGFANYSVKPEERRAVKGRMRVALRSCFHLIKPDVVNVLRTQLGTTHYLSSLSVYSVVQSRHGYMSLLPYLRSYAKTPTL